MDSKKLDDCAMAMDSLSSRLDALEKRDAETAHDPKTGQFTSTNSHGVRVESRLYPWGRLSTAEKGHSYKAVIHPEHAKHIEHTYRTGEARHLPPDEQGKQWRAEKAEHGVTLHGEGKTSTRYHLPIHHEQLNHIMDALEKRADGPFQNMENRLEHEKHPPRDPAAVAAKIGREELGQAEMTRRSVAGRKDAEAEDHRVWKELATTTKSRKQIDREGQELAAERAKRKG